MEADGIANRSEGSLYLSVWRYDPADIKRIDELALRIEDIRQKLTLDLSTVPLTPYQRDGLKWPTIWLHNAFRDALIGNLVDLISRAWEMAPDGVAPPGSPLDDRFRFPDRKSALEYRGKLYLPPLPTDTLISIHIPQLGFRVNATGDLIAVGPMLVD